VEQLTLPITGLLSDSPIAAPPKFFLLAWIEKKKFLAGIDAPEYAVEMILNGLVAQA
jgi:hypothetical protein